MRPIAQTKRLSPAGPADAWLVPRLQMSFRPAQRPIDLPIAKLGGQPVWLDDPFWPVSQSFRTPMTFVGQVLIPGPHMRMSYLFVTDDKDATAETYDPELGENALIVQPGGRIPPFLTGQQTSTGPSLWRRGGTWEERVPVELEIELSHMAPADTWALDREADRQRAERDGDLSIPLDVTVESRSYVGGKPVFWHADLRVPAQWRFHFQLDGEEGWDGSPYALNFGGGTGYAFLSSDEREGRFYWDCV